MVASWRVHVALSAICFWRCRYVTSVYVSRRSWSCGQAADEMKSRYLDVGAEGHERFGFTFTHCIFLATLMAYLVNIFMHFPIKSHWIES